MLIMVILLLIFIAAVLILSQVIPLILAKFHKVQKKKFDKTVDKLDKMFVDVKKEKVFPLFAVSPLVLGVLGFVLFQNPLAILAGIALGLALPTFVVKNLEKRRKKKCHRQLVDALLLLSSSLKSGLSFLQAIEVVVEEMPPPISQELQLFLNENKMGVPFEDALTRLGKRMPSEDLNMLITTILVGRETGGDLGKIFERLVATIRQKDKIASQVETLTLQARLQGMIMMILPIIFAYGIMQINPKFFEIMLGSDKGRMLLVYAVISQMLGMIMIRKFSQVEV